MDIESTIQKPLSTIENKSEEKPKNSLW
jgi:hypothetical protein